MKIKFFTAVLLCLVHFTSYAYWPAIDECYAIDGPANIRGSINGELLDSLDSEHQVKILEIHNSGWFKIGYSEHSDICGGRNFGWTYKYNLRPIASEIGALIENSQIQFVYTNEHYPRPGIFYDRERQGIWLFGEFQSMSIESGHEILLPTPMLLLQYCSDGSQLVNELESVYFEYGGDSGSYTPLFNFKRESSSACLTVNGSVAGLKSYSGEPVRQPYCEKLVNEELYALRDIEWRPPPNHLDSMVTCNFIEFPFTLEEGEVAMTLVNVNIVPSYHEWFFLSEDNQYLVGSVIIP